MFVQILWPLADFVATVHFSACTMSRKIGGNRIDFFAQPFLHIINFNIYTHDRMIQGIHARVNTLLKSIQSLNQQLQCSHPVAYGFHDCV